MDNGAKRALIPIENKRSFLEVTGDVVEHVDPILLWRPQDGGLQGSRDQLRGSLVAYYFSERRNYVSIGFQLWL